MRNTLRFLVFLFSVFTVHAQASASFDVECSSTWALDSIQSPYWNSYHARVSDKVTKAGLETCYDKDNYAKFTDEHSDYPAGYAREPFNFSRLHRLFLVYSRTSENPALVQVVKFKDGKYSQMISIPPKGYFTSIPTNCTPSRLSDGWMDTTCGTANHPARGDERKNLILLADTEPYATAPTIQFYSYHNKLLMVARDEKGEVYRFAYEDTVHRISAKTVKEFLGDKWFRP